jgi:hypothetical protein
VRRSLAAIALAAVFGAGDQFLGARSWLFGPWAIGVSLLSAPWLLIAFFAGWSQPTPRRAACLGTACTLLALAGYWAMTLSPVEGAVVTATGVRGLLAGQGLYAVGGLVSGPLFGWLGYRWRVARDWRAGSTAALVLCCEPLAHAVGGVSTAEVAAGLALALYVAAANVRRAGA